MHFASWNEDSLFAGNCLFDINNYLTVVTLLFNRAERNKYGSLSIYTAYFADRSMPQQVHRARFDNGVIQIEP